mgnify:CR=1 FL=1
MEENLKDKLSKTLFHGTLLDRGLQIELCGVDFEKLNNKADFGKGFYLTDSYALAVTTAKTRYESEKQRVGNACKPIVLKAKINCKNLSKYKIKEFYGETDDWKRFVCTNRWHDKVLKIHPEYDNNIDSRYDIVVGLVADGKLNNIRNLLYSDNYYLSEEVIKAIIPFKTYFCKNIKHKQKKIYTKAYQLSFHNSSFISSCIKYKGYDIIETWKEDGSYEC